jgi:hypothetical protein
MTGFLKLWINVPDAGISTSNDSVLRYEFFYTCLVPGTLVFCSFFAECVREMKFRCFASGFDILPVITGTISVYVFYHKVYYSMHTYSMVQDILWKADSHSVYQTTASFLYGTRRFITVFTHVRHRTLSSGSRIQFAPSILTSLKSILMLSSHLRLGLPAGLLPSGLPTKTL